MFFCWFVCLDSFIANIEAAKNVLSAVEVLSLGLQIVITLFVLQFVSVSPPTVHQPLGARWLASSIYFPPDSHSGSPGWC